MKIAYFARLNKDNAPGIYNKITQSVYEFKKMGYQSELILSNGEGGFTKALPSVIKLFFQLIKSDAKVIIIRNDILISLLFFGIIIQRLKGALIVVDVPTPISNWIKEINLSKHKSLFWRLRRTLLISCSFPWSLLASTRVIHYAQESAYFSFGIKNKIFLSSNGINIDNIPLKKINKREDNVLIMLGVAALADWHGYDRVIKSIAEYESNKKTDLKIYLYIVGDGPVKEDLERLAFDYGVTSFVKFFGFLKGVALNDLYDISNVAIASLGLYRVGLNEASSLKSREYVARGIPFINAGRDMDFEPTPKFVYQVENNESNINLNEIILWYRSLNYGTPCRNLLREYAENRLTFKSKFNELLINLEIDRLNIK